MRMIALYILAGIFISVNAVQLSATERGSIYQHPTGLRFWYPQNWQLQELDEALQLIPNGVETTQEGPSEFYFISGESITGSGISQADDPQVISYVDQQVRSVLPQLRLSNDREYVNLMGTQGLVLNWAGNNNAGKVIEGRAYIVINKDFALTLSAIAYPGLIENRYDSLEKIFTSFVFGEGQLDQALVGTWEKYATASLANSDRIYQTEWTAAQAVSEDKSHLTFYSDGRWNRIDSSHTLMGAGGVWLEDNSKNEYSGEWFADGKRLFMIYKDNTWEDFTYKVVFSDGRRELRTSIGKEATIWRQ